MTAQFIEYELLVSLLVAIATLGIEHVCALYRWPRRFLWAAALIASLVFPLSMALTTRPDHATGIVESIRPSWPSVLRPSVPGAEIRLQERNRRDVSAMMRGPSVAPKQHAAPKAFALDAALKLVWLALSIASIAYYGFIWLRLRQCVALAPSQQIDGIPVRVTDRLGPAAFGLIRPEILMPRWILDAPLPIRSLALEHERQHVAARDPTLLFGAFIAVVLMPWNVVLWWIVRRLRFCLETDCDARVLQTTADARTYAEALLTVCQHHAIPHSGSLVLTSSASWLERRVRIMFSDTSPLSRVLAATGAVWALGLLAAAILVQAPGLAAPGELRKRPPDDTKPGTESVRSAARTRFPDVFDPAFEGMAQLIMVLNRDGSVVRAREHLYTPDKLPRFEVVGIAKDLDLELDPSDILYSDAVDVRPPDREGTERALGYIEYAVLKWPHDPMRAESRVRAAVETYYPELAVPVLRNAVSCTHLVAVLMNDDGSVRQARREDVGCRLGESFSGDELARLNGFGLPEKELGRGGELAFGYDRGQSVWVRYTWPRHADDPADVVELTRGQMNASLWQQHKPRQDTRDDAAIIAQYFPDLEAHGRTDLIRTIEGRRYRVVPWMLFGRDGGIWQAGRSLAMMNSDNSYVLPPLTQEIEARYPGTRVGEAPSETLRVQGVAIHGIWVLPDSPAQKLSDVELGSRKELLVNADFVEDVRLTNPNQNLRNPMVLSVAHAMNFGSPTGIGIGQSFLDRHGESDIPITSRLIATEAGTEAVDLELQTRVYLTTSLSQQPSDAWVHAATVRVRYGSSGTVDMFSTDNDPPRRVQIVLRPQLIRDRPDQP